MSFFNDGPVLFVSPHTDDIELGCGGSIARALEEGAAVHVLVFSAAEESRPPGTPATILKDECAEAMARLGVPAAQVQIWEYPVRRLSEHRQEILDELVRTRDVIKPATVFAPAGSDVHQDHQVVYAESRRAFKDLTVLGYELPWNHVRFAANVFVRLERRHIEAKWNALLAYQTQFDLGRTYFSREFIEGLALVRGTQIKVPFAEAFELERMRV